MSKLRQILKMHCDGHSKQSIAKLYNTSRNTVRKHILHFEALKITCEELSRLKDKDLDNLFRGDMPLFPITKLQTLYSHFSNVEKQLKRRGVTLLSQWEEYRKKYPDGYSRSQFCHYYGLWKKRSHPCMRIEHKAGDKMFIDFAGEKLHIVDPLTGEVKPVEVFVSILGASQLTYVEAVESQKGLEFITATENSLHYFGGAPLAVVPDNLKSAVTKSHKYEPEINVNFELFALHYGMAVVPARVYKPKDKSLVEGAVKIAYNRIYSRLHGKHFFSLEELNKEILIHLVEHNNMLMQGRTYSRRQQFEEMEKQALQPLPEKRFEMRQQSMVTVMKNGHVTLHADKHSYSVPFQYIQKKVKLLYSPSTVEIYHRYELIATHQRVKAPHGYTTIADHLASQHRVAGERTAEYYLTQAKELHPGIERFIQQVILMRPYPEQSFKSCQGILSFAHRVGTDRLIKACNRAMDYGIYNYKIIEKILLKGLDKYDDESETELPMPSHDNIRGGAYYENP